MPIQWKEAFGIVMAEALACGTPVIGFPMGSVPEVVRDGVNGFVCNDAESAARMVSRVGALDRRAIRADCERRFSSDVIVAEYESLLQEMIARTGAGAP